MINTIVWRSKFIQKGNTRVRYCVYLHDWVNIKDIANMSETPDRHDIICAYIKKVVKVIASKSGVTTISYTRSRLYDLSKRIRLQILNSLKAYIIDGCIVAKTPDWKAHVVRIVFDRKHNIAKMTVAGCNFGDFNKETFLVDVFEAEQTLQLIREELPDAQILTREL